MNTRKRFGLRVVLFAMAVLVLTGCPLETTAAFAPENGTPSVRIGYWIATTFDVNGFESDRNGYKLNADGTIADYTVSDDPIEGYQWQQIGKNFVIAGPDVQVSATVESSTFLDCVITDAKDANVLLGTVVMQFLAADEAGLPRVREGHWKFTINNLGNIFEYGVKLLPDGSTEDSPVGEPFPGAGSWVQDRGVFQLSVAANFDDLRVPWIFEALIDSPNFLEGQFCCGTFTARYVPAVNETEPPDEQAPLGFQGDRT